MITLQFLRRLLAANLCLLCGGHVHAEGNCPDGYYPIGGPAVSGCAPIPSNADRQPAQQWERRWGAIATSVPDGILGVSIDKRSKQEATHMAIQNCLQKGGLNCKLKVAYDNQCIAVVVGGGGYNVSNAPTVDEAVAMGMRTCSDEGRSNCHVYYFACSPPTRIQ